MLETTHQLLQRLRIALRGLFHSNSLGDYDKLQQNRQLSYHLKPLTSNATDCENHDKCNKSSKITPIEDKVQIYYNNYKTYLCSYNYMGDEWSFELQATSIEDAQRRLMALRYNGKIDGEVFLEVELKTNWISKILTALTLVFKPDSN
jgi:hypothetical protein